MLTVSKNNPIAEELIRRTAAYVPDMDYDGADRPQAEKPWAKWLDAELGFRNHWYPVEASRNIADNSHKAIKLLGEDILFVRRRGKLFAIEDRCSHRGTRFSVRLPSLPAGRVTGSLSVCAGASATSVVVAGAGVGDFR